MEIFADALSYMAGYGLKAYLITQDIRQIVDEYGRNESIVTNCHVRVAFAPNQFDTAELLSKMTGTQTIRKASFNFSGSRISPVLDHMSTHMDQIERPLMTPDEIMRLRPPKKESAGHRKKSLLPVTCLSLFPGITPFTAHKCSTSLTPSCFPEPRFLRQQSFFLFTMEVSRPRTHSQT